MCRFGAVVLVFVFACWKGRCVACVETGMEKGMEKGMERGVGRGIERGDCYVFLLLLLWFNWMLCGDDYCDYFS